MHQQTGKVKANLKRTCFNEDDGESSRGEKSSESNQLHLKDSNKGNQIKNV